MNRQLKKSNSFYSGSYHRGWTPQILSGMSKLVRLTLAASLRTAPGPSDPLWPLSDAYAARFRLVRPLPLSGPLCLSHTCPTLVPDNFSLARPSSGLVRPLSDTCAAPSPPSFQANEPRAQNEVDHPSRGPF